jgi:hypothetical protein
MTPLTPRRRVDKDCEGDSCLLQNDNLELTEEIVKCKWKCLRTGGSTVETLDLVQFRPLQVHQQACYVHVLSSNMYFTFLNY